MFWTKKKAREVIKDPVTKYGKLIRDNKVSNPKSEPKKSLLAKLFRSGYDSGFVYYDE